MQYPSTSAKVPTSVTEPARSSRSPALASALVALALAALALPACGDEESESCSSGTFRCNTVCLPVPEASLQYIQDEVFNQQCNIRLCHGQPESQLKEDLRLYDAQTSYDELVNVESVQRDGALLVVPGSSAQSYLMNKLTGVDMEPVSSTNEPTEIMPSGSAPDLCQEQIDVVRDWIDGGAPRTGVASTN